MYVIILPQTQLLEHFDNSLNHYIHIFLHCCKKKSSLFLLHWTLVISTRLWHCMSNFQLTTLKYKTDNISRKYDRGKTFPILANFKGKSSYMHPVKCSSYSVKFKEEERKNLSLTLHKKCDLFCGIARAFQNR